MIIIYLSCSSDKSTAITKPAESQQQASIMMEGEDHVKAEDDEYQQIGNQPALVRANQTPKFIGNFHFNMILLP